jgi:hypothetical protein
MLDASLLLFYKSAIECWHPSALTVHPKSQLISKLDVHMRWQTEFVVLWQSLTQTMKSKDSSNEHERWEN